MKWAIVGVVAFLAVCIIGSALWWLVWAAVRSSR